MDRDGLSATDGGFSVTIGSFSSRTSSSAFDTPAANSGRLALGVDGASEGIDLGDDISERVRDDGACGGGTGSAKGSLTALIVLNF